MALPEDESTIQWGEEGNLEEETDGRRWQTTECVEVKEGGNLHIESKYQHFDSSAVDADKEVGMKEGGEE